MPIVWDIAWDKTMGLGKVLPTIDIAEGTATDGDILLEHIDVATIDGQPLQIQSNE